jgi:pimeloyl-ACP methyl ester carboxylesterase
MNTPVRSGPAGRTSAFAQLRSNDSGAYHAVVRFQTDHLSLERAMAALRRLRVACPEMTTTVTGLDRRLNLINTWQCPLLVLQGKEDPFQPYGYFEAIKKHIPNSTLAFVDAGHFPPLESPDETTEEIAAFLAK